MQFVWFLARGTRVGRPQREIMLWELPGGLEVGPLMAMPLVRPSWPWRAARGWMKLRVAAR